MQVLLSTDDSLPYSKAYPDTSPRPISRKKEPFLDPHSTASIQPVAMTPRREEILELLGIPISRTKPAKEVRALYGDEKRHWQMIAACQEFTLNLHAGMYLTYLTNTGEREDIHCQLMDDLTTIKLDDGNGKIIVFPLPAVSTVSRGLRKTQRVPEHLVIMEFMRRKLKFAFMSEQDTELFATCMKLIISKAGNCPEQVLGESLCRCSVMPVIDEGTIPV